MKLVATRKSEQNRAALDPWTVVHFSTGLAFGLMRLPFRWTLPVAVGYEFLEQLLERKKMGREVFETSGPESVPNATLDVVAFAAGHALGELWHRTEE